ncbi:MAG: outer membrane beta-barrel domain-containing protein [Pseudomonadales bacterium]|nr:outer membrane beta-barrel domain-containing protein [Pseudomonadales bacterium]
MENWICRIFLKLAFSVALCISAVTSFAESDSDDEAVEVREASPLIEPHILRLDLNEAEIDTENFEVGLHYGRISVEDFGVNDVGVLTFAYHVTEDFFIEAAGGLSELQRPIEEKFAGGITISNELDYTYYNISLGVNVFPGEVFLWKDWAFNSQVYVIGGVGVTEHYLGAKDTTLNIGIGYRLIVWDWLALRVDFRDHLYERDQEVAAALGETDQKLVNNLEIRAGASVFF